MKPSNPLDLVRSLFSEWEKTSQPLKERMSVLPFGQYEDGSVGLAWPGMVAAPFEGVANFGRYGYDTPEAITDNARSAFDVAGGAMTGGLGVGLAGGMVDNALGSAGGKLTANALERAQPQGIRAAATGTSDEAGRLANSGPPIPPQAGQMAGDPLGRTLGVSQDQPELAGRSLIGSDPSSGTSFNPGFDMARPSAEIADELLAFLRNSDDIPQQIGLRSDVGGFSRGERLQPSRVWDDGVPTEDLLPGTSAIKLADMDEGLPSLGKVESFVRQLQTSYPNERGYLIGSDFGEYGVDPGEIVLRNARVLYSNAPTGAAVPLAMEDGEEIDLTALLAEILGGGR